MLHHLWEHSEHIAKLQAAVKLSLQRAAHSAGAWVRLTHLWPGMQVKTAVKDGYDLRGYHYWTLLDNFEWNFAYDLKFGLYEWDREDPAGKRTLRNGAKVGIWCCPLIALSAHKASKVALISGRLPLSRRCSAMAAPADG